MTRYIPILFVFLWSTGFIGAKLGLPFAEPYTFLFIRMTITSAILLVVLLVLKKSWPSSWKLSSHVALSGVLIHCGYLGGVFTAIKLGMPSGLAALIAGLQPLLTAFAAQPVLGEKVKPVQWLGLSLGLAGIVLVLSEKLDLASNNLFDGFGPWAVVAAFFAVLSITASSLYQKKYCTDMPLMSGTFIQYCAAALLYSIAAVSFETMAVQWTGQFIFALFWLIFMPSFGAISLLMWMIKQGEASKVASLFYMVPPVTALEAFFLFDETLGLAALIGMAVASLGVWMAVKK
ncbi:DMT family permease [Candidatus Terasakiella magnetica]|uniref:DMT family permease n=1 Tax=Candidatus Terasakiella magnetica TaxID=1867952 RepID=A0A1C3RIK3_9PROT|nr:DMT family transporter [Candidatus Terasakiella magnetica]SCA57110.1 DMT family permease [Candidatus Terasakiella magnetica]